MKSREIVEFLRNELEPLDFECHPFKIDWYNSCVASKYTAPYDPNTLAVLVLNTPGMFEKLFLPYLFENFKNNRQELDNLNDPIDKCLAKTFDDVKEKLEQVFADKSIEVEVDVVKDYDMTPGTRRPKFVMQTCAHVSGAAYFYKQELLEMYTPPESQSNGQTDKKNLMGVCLHPVYGGWFALRCVFVFKGFSLNEKDDLYPKLPRDPLLGELDRILDLLKKFNHNWKDWSYRNVIRVKARYSELQKEYFRVEPKNRRELIEKWLDFEGPVQLWTHYEQLNCFSSLVNESYLHKNFYLN